MLKKKISIAFIIILFLFTSIFIAPHDKFYRVDEVLSPNEFIIEGKYHKLDGIETFDSTFSQKNKILAEKIGISEEEAFLLGNLAKQWAINLVKGRNVLKYDEDLIYYKYSYLTKFKHSGYYLENSNPYLKDLFKIRLNSAKKGNYKVLDLKTNNVYSYKDKEVRELIDFIVLRNYHIKRSFLIQPKKENINYKFERENIKVLLSNMFDTTYPKQDCSTEICKEILDNINKSEKSIDIAIYGYSTVPDIEKALKSAISRGVNVRLIYDRDSKKENIYPNTEFLLKLIPQNLSDVNSIDFQKIMHNKFYIFDEERLITGSANLSNTDMSGFNSNSIISIKSKEMAKIYKQEFEQMYNGKFHREKAPFLKPDIKIDSAKISAYFSPQDKAIEKAILPLIRNAKKYIYIPTFVLTEKRVANELINAKKRGVEVKILIDALNASVKHSKHNELRLGGIEVKTENYAGKMHSKSMIVDDKYTIIGSMNFSNSGENFNDENLILIEDVEIAKFYRDFFLYQWNKVDKKWLKYNARAEGKDSIGSCNDGLDNNYDGLIDKDDIACK